jgi:hypothetical protein
VFVVAMSCSSIFSSPCTGPATAQSRARLGRGEDRTLDPNDQIIHITQSSILSRIHATAHTPDTVVKGLANAEHVAIAEAHAPREGRILHMCRR